MPHVVVVHFQRPLCQEIEHRPDPRHLGAALGPHTMVPLLAVADGGAHRQHRFHHHPCVPGPARTDLQGGGIPSLGMESGVCEDDHEVVTLGQQGCKCVSWTFAGAQSQAQITPHWCTTKPSLPPTIHRCFLWPCLPICAALRPARIGWMHSMPEVSATPSTEGAARNCAVHAAGVVKRRNPRVRSGTLGHHIC
jgi:hypothetical protein